MTDEHSFIMDADGAILGRLAVNVAKRILSGEKVIVVNAEKAIITGNRLSIFQEYKEMHQRGHRYAGPFFPTAPHMILKRAIRGMIPWGNPRGREAFKRLTVHIGNPDNAEAKTPPVVKGSGNAPKFVRLLEVAKILGWNPKM